MQAVELADKLTLYMKNAQIGRRIPPKGKVMNIEYDNYKRLQGERREVIVRWFKCAWNKRNPKASTSFDPFFRCWVSFNAWAACVTNMYCDRGIIECLKTDSTLSLGFEKLRAKDESFKKIANAFQKNWPIFDVRELNRLNIQPQGLDKRCDVVKYYVERGATEYVPKIPGKESLVGDAIELNWPHTIEALYRVRCNLFHGHKNPELEADQEMVGTAFRVLVNFFKYCLEAPEAFERLGNE